LKNDYTTVSGEYNYSDLKIITEICSYVVPNIDFVHKYQTGVWDGKISLFNKKTMSFSSGMLTDVCSELKAHGVKFTVQDKRPKPKVKRLAVVDLGEHSFRDYQEKAIEIFKEKTRGILAMCTGAGKTKTSCGLISELSVYPVVFVVPSISLLKQTVREFKESLKPLDSSFCVGELGGGVYNIAENGVNVATYQTLLTAFGKKYSIEKKKIIDISEDKKNSIKEFEKKLKVLNVDLTNSPSTKRKSIEKKIKEVENKIKEAKKVIVAKTKIRELIEKCQFLIIDETHIAAETVELISLKAINAYYKCGLSGTPKRLDNQDIRMFGSTGPIIHKVTSSDLIKRGFLVKPYIYPIDISFINKSGATYQETYKEAIVLNEARNQLIRDLAIEMHKQGRPTLIMVERLEHGRDLQAMIENCLFVPGSDGSDDKPIPDEELDYRKYQLDRLEKNEIIMCATSWCYTGIDAPKISCLILACSIGSPNIVTQQIGRGLRLAKDKNSCIIFDFKMGEQSLKRHFSSRSKVYSSEEEFVVKVLKYNNGKESYV
jgi:superfamily II DNA or RNA helicase